MYLKESLLQLILQKYIFDFSIPLYLQTWSIFSINKTILYMIFDRIFQLL